MNDDYKSKKHATRTAIEFLTLWLEPDRRAAAEHIVHMLGEPLTANEMTAVTGLLNLNMLTLFELAAANGAEDPKAWAGDYLRDLSLRLPGTE